MAEDTSSRLDLRAESLDRRSFLRTAVGGAVASVGGVMSGTPAAGAEVDIIWEFEIGSTVYSSPTVVDGTVFVGSFDNNLYAVDTSSGEQQWTFETDWSVWSSPTVVDGTVFVGSADNTLYALDASSGEQQWTVETGSWIRSSPTVADGTVFVGSDDDTLYAVDTDSGERQWTFETGNRIVSSPTVADGTVFVGSNDETLYAVDTDAGEQQWAFDAGDRVESSPTVADETVFVGCGDGDVYAVDTDAGEQQWTFETGGYVSSSPTVVDGTVFVGSADWNVYAVDTSSGEQQWAFETEGRVESSPTVAGGTVFVGSADDILYALDSALGGEFWSFETGNRVVSSPTVADGTVFVGSYDDTLYALDAGVNGASQGSRVRHGTLGHHDNLIPQNVTVEITDFNSPVTPGNSITVTATIRNAGSRRASEIITAEFAVDQPQLSRRQVDLESGDSTTETFELGLAPEETGEYSARVSSSTDEVTTSIRVVESASLTVGIVDLGASVVAGDDLTFDVALTNTGEVQTTRTVDVALGNLSDLPFEITLEPGETIRRTVTLATPADVTGSYPVTVSSGDAEATQSVELEEVPADPSGGGTGDSSSSDGVVGRETMLAAGGGGVGAGTLLGAYALLRRRRQTSISRPSSSLDGDESVDDTDETTADDSPTGDADTTSDETLENDSDVTALQTAIPDLDSLAKQSRNGEFLTYRGYHTEADAHVRIHTLVPEADANVQQAFTQAVSGWYNGHSHPNVVTIHDRGTDPRPWVAVDRFLDSSSLATVFERAPSEVVAVMTDAAEAIRNVGLYNVSHGNLAPEHVWVTEDDDGPQAASATGGFAGRSQKLTARRW